MKTKRSRMRNKRRRIRERKRKEERRLNRIAERMEKTLTKPLVRAIPIYNVDDAVFVSMPNAVDLAEGVIRQRNLLNNSYEIHLREDGVVVRNWNEIISKPLPPPTTFPKVQGY